MTWDEKQHAAIADEVNILRTKRMSPEQWDIVDQFHRFYYEERYHPDTTWMGYYVLKPPQDLLTYQELIFNKRPDYIVETGTAWGGSALFFATICDLVGHGQVISVDQCTDVPGLYRWAYGDDQPVPKTERPEHPRITYVTGNVLNPTTIRTVRERVHGTCMVTLDSHHDAGHVCLEMHLWAPLVTLEQYLVVEDTNVGGHPVMSEPWDGPYNAVLAFLNERDDFLVDLSLSERFLMSYNTWLARRKEQ